MRPANGINTRVKKNFHERHLLRDLPVKTGKIKNQKHFK